MIIKFKIFEQLDDSPMFKIGDTVYYHGMHRTYHGYYKVIRVYFTHVNSGEKDDTGWRYNIDAFPSQYRSLAGVWEMSLSPTEEEGKEKDRRFQQRLEDMRALHLDHDPYGEEVWESKSDIDPYGEEKWDDTSDIVELRNIALELILNPTEIRHDNADNADYFEFEINYPKKGKLRFSVSNGSIWWRGDNVMSLISNYSLNIHGPRFTIMDDVIRNVSSDSFVRAYTRIAQLQDNVKNENHDIDPYGEEQWVEDDRWINVPDDYLLKRGDKVKIRPDSPYHTERGINGGLYRYEGTILNDRKRKSMLAFCWDVRFDNGQTRNYRTKDLMMKIDKDNGMWESLHADIDPYGEEVWNDRDVERQPGRWDREIDLHNRQEARGEEMFGQWCANNHEYGDNRFPGRFLRDRHVCSHGESWDKDDFPFGRHEPLHDYENPLNAGILPLSDFYDDDTQKYTCPKCSRTSTANREHGSGWICRKCGLKSRNWGNALFVWE